VREDAREKLREDGDEVETHAWLNRPGRYRGAATPTALAADARILSCHARAAASCSDDALASVQAVAIIRRAGFCQKFLAYSYSGAN